MNQEKTPVKGAAAFAKSIALLQMVADATKPLKISDLVRSSDIPRPTLHRIMKALASEGLVDVRPDKTFVVGSRVIRLAGRALEQNPIVPLARPEVDRLVEETGETVHLATVSSGGLVYLIRKECQHRIRIASDLGGPVPVHASAIGKAVLANLPVPEREALLASLDLKPITEHTITDLQQLRSQLELAQQQGFATTDQESDMEIKCFGCAVLDSNRRPLGGVSVSVPLFRLERIDQRSGIIEPLIQCCERISNKFFFAGVDKPS